MASQIPTDAPLSYEDAGLPAQVALTENSLTGTKRNEAVKRDVLHVQSAAEVGRSFQMEDENEALLVHCQKAMQADPNNQAIRRDLASLQVRLGRRAESLDLWHAELSAGPESLEWVDGLISRALRTSELRLAGEYAAVLAELRHGSAWYPKQAGTIVGLPMQAPETFLTISKLRHDMQQFDYLQRRGVLGADFTPIIKDYQRVVDRLVARRIKHRIPIDDETHKEIGHVYNRLVHVRQTPRLARALSGNWDVEAAEQDYLEHPIGLIVVDDFLSPEALESVRLFCLESTVWSTNRYGYGRLGSFFRDGFNCPLLLQIAEELQAALPRVIGDRYPLRQIWGFKNCEDLPRDATNHADFAAVNVNFWITPEEANLEPTSGGMIVYDVDAPLTWGFEIYNRRADLIKYFLRQQDARAVEVPYRQNRAIIFNSDLFHGTSAVRFRPGYENRRINITMLYGDRVNDVHHSELARRSDLGAPQVGTGAWRSAAFSSRRGPSR